MKPIVTLVQRYCPHYRKVFFSKLERLSRYRWMFQFGSHPGLGAGGLVAETEHLQPHVIDNHWLRKIYCWQSGVSLGVQGVGVLVFELNYSILSNPVLCGRAKKRGLKRIGWGKGISESGSQRSWAKRQVERVHLAGCDAIIAYGETSRRYYENMGIAPECIFVAQNTTDTTAILGLKNRAIHDACSLRERLFSGDSRPVIGYLGRLVPEKRVDAIVSAFERVRQSGMMAILVIAGKGPAMHELREQVDASPWHEDIRFVEEVPEGAEHGFFHLFDVYVSYAVGGLGIMEAMAHGCAIACTPEKRPELDLLIDNKTAFISNESTIESFAETLRRSLFNFDTRIAVGETARRRVLNSATQEKMVESFDRAIDYVLTLN